MKLPAAPLQNVSVKPSSIQGKGVFAERGFPKAEKILEIDDSHVVEDFEKLTKEQQSFECDFLGDGRTVLMQPPERYINHSCDPNTYVQTVSGTRTLFAMRDIKAGEEITYDYAINGYYDGDVPKCACGSPKCRKILNCDFFKLPRARQLEYLPYLDTWFKEQFKERLNKVITE